MITTCVLESPFASPSKDPEIYAKEVARNLRYTRAAMRDCLTKHHVAPFPSHALYTQPGVLDDQNAEERMLGINAGLDIGDRLDATFVYLDLGISKGMIYGIERAIKAGRPVSFHHLSTEILKFHNITPVEIEESVMKSILDSLPPLSIPSHV